MYILHRGAMMYRKEYSLKRYHEKLKHDPKYKKYRKEYNERYREENKEKLREKSKKKLKTPEYKKYKRQYDKQYKQHTLQYHRDKMIKIKNEHGGICQSCGYNKNYAALIFHHSDKNKDIGVNKLYKAPIDKIRKEAKKCKLMCANCHQDLHHPELRR